MENSVNRKRIQDESAGFPDTKRLREADIIFDILDDENDDYSNVDRNPNVGVLADVIKSLEEEIVAPVTAAADDNGSSRLDIGYLLEASDDELGLPPAVESTSGSSLDDGVDGFNRIWGFEDDVTAASPYEGLEFCVQTEFDDGVMFDGGLFDYGGGVFEPSEAKEFPWHAAAV